jgi:uncharacterized protein YbaR (Trm112 family)
MGDSGLPRTIRKTLRRVLREVKAIALQRVPGVTGTVFASAFEESNLAQLLLWDSVWYSANSRKRMLETGTENPMELPKYALDILVCPVCKTRVELLTDGSGLKCGSCRRVYPVRDEIPAMMPEEAKIADD